MPEIIFNNYYQSRQQRRLKTLKQYIENLDPEESDENDQTVTSRHNDIGCKDIYTPTSSTGSFASSKNGLNDIDIWRIMINLSEQVSQNCLRTEQILRVLSKNESCTLVKPDNFPSPPLYKTKVFKELGHLFEGDDNYLRQKLSTLGGASVCQVTTNILKYLLSNKMAKKMNWAGDNGKLAFKSTKMIHIIQDAVLSSLHVESSPDLNLHNFTKEFAETRFPKI